MSKFTNYITRQAQRPLSHITYDFFVVGALVTCIYFGFIH
jgi:hypothetical protein